MKQLLTIIALVMIVMIAQKGYAQVRETQVTINKKKQNALSIEVNNPAKDVEKAWHQSFTDKGMKGKSSKGQYTYNNVVIPAWGNDSFNVVTSVQPLSNGRSVIYLTAIRPNGTYVTTDTDGELVDKMSDYLYDFVSDRQYTSPDLDIHRAMDSVQLDEQADKKYSDDRRKLEEDRKRLDQQLNDMDGKYQKEKMMRDDRKRRLDQMKSDRESGRYNPANMQDRKRKDSTDKQSIRN